MMVTLLASRCGICQIDELEKEFDRTLSEWVCRQYPTSVIKKNQMAD